MGKSSCKSWCIPKCKRRCVKSFTDKYKLYETRSYSLFKVCSCCGYEFNYRHYPACPRCGGFMVNLYGDPRRGMFGMSGGMGREGRFEGFDHSGFSKFRPEFEREHFEDEPFFGCESEFQW